jgi:hypothetical protein
MIASNATQLEIKSAGGLTVRPKFGQRVKARHCLRKQRQWSGHSRADYGHYEVAWERAPGVEGIYIGYRDVKEGVLERWEDHDEFHESRSLRVWLIVPNERTNPVHALPEDVELIDDAISPSPCLERGPGGEV